MSIYEMIEALREMGVNNSAIKAALKKKDFSDEEIEAALPATKRRTFATEFYDWLAEEPRGEEEAREFIMDPENSENVRKHLSHYMNIWELSARIWEGK